MITLRDYQDDAIGVAQSALAAGLNLILVAPTGSGKTEIAFETIRRGVLAGRRFLFVTERKTLLHQTFDRFRSYGLKVGMLGAGIEDYRHDDDVLVCTIQTLGLRVRDKNKPLDYHGAFVDEAHILHKHHEILFNAPFGVVGLTATPHNDRIGHWFADMYQVRSVRELTEEGFLSPMRTFRPRAQVDTTGVKHQAGDFNTKELAVRVKRIHGDVVGNWIRHGEGRPTIAFCCNIQHSKELTEQFKSENVPAEHVDLHTTQDELKAITARLVSGETKVVCSVIKLTAGFDCPVVSCVILARPTASEMLYIQMAGRGARVHEGKVDCLLFDHAGNVDRFGDFTDYAPPELDDVGERNRAKYERPERSATDKFCDDCGNRVSDYYEPCGHCGYQRERTSSVIYTDAELAEMEARQEAHDLRQEALRFYLETLSLCEERGWRHGKAFISTEKRFGIKAPWAWKEYERLEPSEETVRWHKNDFKRYKLLQRKGYA